MSKPAIPVEIKLRMDPSLKRRIAAWAKHLDLSMNRYIIAVLTNSEKEQAAKRRTPSTAGYVRMTEEADDLSHA